MPDANFYSSDGPDLKYTEVAVLATTCNKYDPGIQNFYLQSLNPMNPKSKEITTTKADNQNLQNENSDVGISEVNTSNCISLIMPKDVARWFDVKWIPPGTRFLISFIGGDITKPIIVGRDFNAVVDNKTK